MGQNRIFIWRQVGLRVFQIGQQCEEPLLLNPEEGPPNRQQTRQTVQKEAPSKAT